MCEKVERFVNAIGSLLPNVNGPTDSVRKLYYVVWESMVLYAEPIWASSLDIEKNKRIVISV